MEVDGGLLAHRAVDACGAFRLQRAHAAEHGVNGVHRARPAAAAISSVLKGVQSAAWAARPARPKKASAATIVRSESTWNNHVEPCATWPAAECCNCGMGLGVLGGRAVVGRVAMRPAGGDFVIRLAGAEIVVRPAQVMPEVMGHVNPQGVAAQADQGQEKLEDQDGCPHRGTDHKDDGHGYLLADKLRKPRVFRRSTGDIGTIRPQTVVSAADLPTQVP